LDISSIIKDNFLVFEQTAPLSEVIGQLKEKEKQAAVVVRKGKYLGIIEKHKVMRSTVDLCELKLEHCLQETPLLNKESEVVEAVSLLCDNNCDFLPVQEGKKMVGIVNIVDLLNLSLTQPVVGKLKVSDIKFSKPNHIDKESPLSIAVEAMQKDNLTHMPIFDQDKLYGILSYKDVVRKQLNWSPKRDFSAKFNQALKSKSGRSENVHFFQMPVRDFSTNDNLITVSLKSPLKEAVGLMDKHNLKGLIVMDGLKYQGILTARNILLTLAKLEKRDNFEIFYVGLNEVDLTENQRNMLQDSTYKEAVRLQRKFKETFAIAVHLKESNKQGKQKLFKVNLRVESVGKLYTSEKEDWDLETALHKCFNGLKV
jgi:CBS domain-containing protein